MTHPPAPNHTVASVALAAALLLLAGCATPATRTPGPAPVSPTGSDASGHEPASNDSKPVDPDLVAPAEPLLLYEFNGTVTGAAPPMPPGQPGTVLPFGAARADTFQVPTQVTVREVAFRICGTGYYRIDVQGPDGASVFRTGNAVQAGAPAVPLPLCPAILAGEETESTSRPPGTYTVQYEVLGSVSFDVRILGARTT